MLLATRPRAWHSRVVSRRQPQAATPALTVLRRAGVPHTVRAYEHDPAARSYGLEAVEALGVEPERVFKTLVAAADGALCVAVVPVTATLDLKALAAAVGAKKAVMADPGEAERVTGYVVGGISPLGQRRALTTVLDRSAFTRDTVLVSAGRRGLDVELSPADLAATTRAATAAIAR